MGRSMASKISYGGFSPVRLQTSFLRRHLRPPRWRGLNYVKHSSPTPRWTGSLKGCEPFPSPDAPSKTALSTDTTSFPPCHPTIQQSTTPCSLLSLRPPVKFHVFVPAPLCLSVFALNSPSDALKSHRQTINHESRRSLATPLRNNKST